MLPHARKEQVFYKALAGEQVSKPAAQLPIIVAPGCMCEQALMITFEP